MSRSHENFNSTPSSWADSQMASRAREFGGRAAEVARDDRVRGAAREVGMSAVQGALKGNGVLKERRDGSTKVSVIGTARTAVRAATNPMDVVRKGGIGAAKEVRGAVSGGALDPLRQAVTEQAGGRSSFGASGARELESSSRAQSWDTPAPAWDSAPAWGSERSRDSGWANTGPSDGYGWEQPRSGSGYGEADAWAGGSRESGWSPGNDWETNDWAQASSDTRYPETSDDGWLGGQPGTSAPATGYASSAEPKGGRLRNMFRRGGPAQEAPAPAPLADTGFGNPWDPPADSYGAPRSWDNAPVPRSATSDWGQDQVGQWDTPRWQQNPPAAPAPPRELDINPWEQHNRW